MPDLPKPLVSIITPTFNCKEYISDCVDSVLAQTYTNWELVIIDDNSQDGTVEVLQQIQTAAQKRGDTRIKVHYSTENVGAALTRNHALRLAQGDWVAFLDGDDLWHPEKLQRQLEFALSNGRDFCYTDYQLIDGEGKSLHTQVFGPWHLKHKDFVRYNWVGCLTVMYNARKVGLIQIPNLRKRNDYALWLEVSKRADCYRFPHILASYRKGHGQTLSSESVSKLVKYHFQVFKAVEHQPTLVAAVSTMRNLFWGAYRRTRYLKPQNPE